MSDPAYLRVAINGRHDVGVEELRRAREVLTLSISVPSGLVIVGGHSGGPFRIGGPVHEIHQAPLYEWQCDPILVDGPRHDPGESMRPRFARAFEGVPG